MCIKEDYNKIMECNDGDKLWEWRCKNCDPNNVEAKPEDYCTHFGCCAYCGWLDDKLKVLDGEADECISCGEIISFEDADALYYDANNNPYCEACWIAHEARLKGISK